MEWMKKARKEERNSCRIVWGVGKVSMGLCVCTCKCEKRKEERK